MTGKTFRNRKDPPTAVAAGVTLDRMEGVVKVAVVEDDPTVREAVGEYLRAHGYAVSSFGDGASARTALRETVPDVVIVDRMLPGISGDELCRELRAASDVPIMMLTALGEVEDRIDGSAFGVDDYLA